MPKFANVVTIEVAPGRRDQVVALLAAHKARLKSEPGTLQFEMLLPNDDDTKVLSFEMYRDAAAFEVHLETSWSAVRGSLGLPKVTREAEEDWGRLRKSLTTTGLPTSGKQS